MLMSRNPDGQIEAYTDIGQFIGILPPDFPGLDLNDVDRHGPVSTGDEEIWRSTEEGKHFKLETKTGEIKGGFGGRFNGKRLGESWGVKKNGEPMRPKHPKLALPAGPQTSSAGGSSSSNSSGSSHYNLPEWARKLPEAVQSKLAGVNRGMEHKMQAAQKIESMWERGYITVHEMEEAKKRGGLEGIDIKASVEQNIMKAGTMQEKRDLIDSRDLASNWAEKAGELIEKNWDADDKALAKALAEKYGESMRQEGIPHDSNVFGTWDLEDLNTWYDLKSKAMGGPVSGKQAPDALQISAGLKEPPKSGPDYSWYNPTHVGNMEAYMETVVGGAASYGHRYTEQEFRELNQRFVDHVKYNKMSPNDACYYATSAVGTMRQRMGLFGLNKPTKEMLGRLSSEEQQRLLDIVNRFQSMNRFSPIDPVQSIEALTYDDLEAAERHMRHTNGNTIRSAESQKPFKDYVLLQEKMLIGIEPTGEAERNEKTKQTEKERVEKEREEREREQQRIEALNNSPQAQAEKQAAAQKRAARENREKVRQSDGKFATGVGADYYEKVAEAIDQCENIDAKVLWDVYSPNVRVYSTTGGRGGKNYYTPGIHAVTLSNKINEAGTRIAAPFQSVFHEVGHAIDHSAGDKFGFNGKYFSEGWHNGEFCDTIEREAKSFVDRIGNEQKKLFEEMKSDPDRRRELADTFFVGSPQYSRIKWGDAEPKWSASTKAISVASWLNNVPRLACGTLCDAVQGATRSKVKPSVGHAASYYKGYLARQNMATEAFANLYGSMVRNPASYSMMKQHFPETVACFERMVHELSVRG